MAEKLKGTVFISKRLLEHPVWTNDPTSYGHAWVDLILLANDQPRTAFVHGEPIPLNRGQLIRSVRVLMQRWQRSDKWVISFLKFCVDQTMITVDSNRRRTIITVINYDAYNTLDSHTEGDTEGDTEAVTDSHTEADRKVETGIGSGKVEAKPQQMQAFAEVPSEAEVLEFARSYHGDIARGIPASIPEGWALSWFAFRSGGNSWPKKWRDSLLAAFKADWVSGHPKARGRMVPTVAKKNAAGRSPAQERFELGRELEELTERIDAAYDCNTRPDARDQARERELKKLLAAMDAVQTQGPTS